MRAGVGANVLLRAGDLDDRDRLPQRPGARSGPASRTRSASSSSASWSRPSSPQRAVDWSNSLFLSCRFRAWREGPYNEYVYNFFKSLSVERMRRTEAEALRKLDPDRGGIAGEEFRIGDYICERTCPHRQADLTVFGEIEGDQLVCTLHGWRFDLETGECLNATNRKLQIRRADN